MMKGRHRILRRLKSWPSGVSLLVGAMMLFLTPEPGETSRFAGTRAGSRWYESLDDLDRVASRAIRISGRRGQRPAPQQQWDQYDGLSPEEKERLRDKYRQWESLPPEKQQVLRRRMERWKELPSEDRELLRKRHRQWQELSPQERQRIRENLDRWKELSPEEQERVRQRFRRPGSTN